VGGKKKLTLKQIEKQQRLRREKRERGGRVVQEKRVGGIFAPDGGNPEVLEELRRMRVLTPYLVASKYGVRLSVAKDFLEALEAKGFVERVAHSRYTRVYRVLD